MTRGNLCQRLWGAIHLLSVDTVLGVGIGYYFVCWTLGVPYSILWSSVLMASTWLVYTLDRLLDARSILGQTITARYCYHYQYRFQLIAVMVGFCVLLVMMTMYVPVYIELVLGVGLLAIHFLCLRYRWYGMFKEVSVAIIYTLAIWLGPIKLLENSYDYEVLVVMHGGIVYLNLIMSSIMDLAEDCANQQWSVTRIIGVDFSMYLFWLVGSGGLIMAGIGIWMYTHLLTVFITFLLMIISHFIVLMIYCYFTRYSSNSLKPIGELIFFIPIWILVRHV